MSSKKILVLNGHPAQQSLSQSLAGAYEAAAVEAGHDVRRHDLPQMQFDADYEQSGYKNTKPLEPDLERFLEDLEWADHLVLAMPMWWGAMPGKLKGMFDRVLLPGRTFDTRITSMLGLPAPMLTGKTARVFLTSDTPSWALRLIYGNAIKNILTRQILGFVGLKPTRFTAFAPATDADEKKVSRWLQQASRLGRKAA